MSNQRPTTSNNSAITALQVKSSTLKNRVILVFHLRFMSPQPVTTHSVPALGETELGRQTGLVFSLYVVCFRRLGRSFRIAMSCFFVAAETNGAVRDEVKKKGKAAIKKGISYYFALVLVRILSGCHDLSFK